MANFYISAFADEASEELDLQIAALKRNEIRFIEPRNIGGGLIEKSEEELRNISERLSAAGIEVSSLGSPIGKYKIEEPFEPHLQSFRKALRACKILGTKNMRIFSFFVDRENPREYREEVMRRLSIMLDEAEVAGIRLCHENEAKIYGQNPKEVKDLLETLPRMRGIFDAANYIIDAQDPIAGIEATLPTLEYLHIKDANLENRVITPVGMGDGQYDEVLRRVDAAYPDKTIFLTVEPHLFKFKAFKKIDLNPTLRTSITFESADKAFDTAVSNLKKLLNNLGYHEEENKLWKK